MDANWYKNWFGNEYLTIYAHRDEWEAQKLLKLIQNHIHLDKSIKIVDLCCGQGRHALLLAEQGFEVYGIDLSRTLLEIAKYKKDPGQKAFFIQADMRYLPMFRSFDLLLNLFTSFGYFETDKQNIAVFEQFSQVLRNQGNFVFDYFHAGHVSDNLIPFQSEKFGNVLVEQERHIENSRVQKKIMIEKGNNRSVFYESVKMYEPDQIISMMENSHLRIDHVFGDYAGNPLCGGSPRMIVIGHSV